MLVLRRDRVDHEHFTTPSVFPILGIIVSGALLIYTAINDFRTFTLAALLIGIGVVLYVINVFAKRSLDRENPEAHGD